MPYVFQTFSKDGKPHAKWRFQYTDWRGKRCTKTGTKSKQETEKLAHREEAYHEEIRRGFRPPPKESDAAAQRPFGDVLDEYLAWGNAQGGRRGRPWSKGHSRMQRARLDWWKKELRLKSLLGLEKCLPKVEKALRGLQSGGAAGKTLNDYAASLKGFCNWCIDRDYMENDPLKKLKRFDATPKDVRRAVTAEEIMRLLNASPDYRRILYETAFCSGLRAKELRSLQVQDLDVRRGGLRLHAEWTKNRQDGFQPLPAIVVEHLSEFASTGLAKAIYRRQFIRGGSKAECPKDPLLYVPTHPSRTLKADLEAAGIPERTAEGKIDFHALRVAYVSFVIETGADLKTAQSLARHTTPELTMNIYARVRGSRLNEVTEAVAKLVFPLVKTKPAEPAARPSANPAISVPYARSSRGSIPAASTINSFNISALRATTLGAGAIWVKTQENQ